MFWGISLDVGKRYTQTVEKSFHISMAAIRRPGQDTNKGAVTVMVEVEKACYPICTLQPYTNQQQVLDYIFTEGEEVLFYTEGDIDVHLTGYLLDEPSPFEYSDDSASGSNAASSDDEIDGGKKKTNNSDNESSEEETLDTLISELDGLNEDNENSVNIWLHRSARVKQKSEDVDDESTAPVSSLTEKLLDNGDSEESGDDDWIPGSKHKLKKKQKSKGTTKEKKTKQNLDNSKTEDSESSRSKLNSSKSKKHSKKKSSDGDGGKSDASNGVDINQDKKSNMEQSNKMEVGDCEAEPLRRELPGGLIIEDIVKGDGKKAKRGRQVSVYYKGCLKKSMKEFDSCLEGSPFRFKLGQGEVIKGWDNGVEGMQIGGKRRIIIPPSLGYGARKMGSSIPANSTLIFVVELVNVH